MRAGTGVPRATGVGFVLAQRFHFNTEIAEMGRSRSARAFGATRFFSVVFAGSVVSVLKAGLAARENRLDSWEIALVSS